MTTKWQPNDPIDSTEIKVIQENDKQLHYNQVNDKWMTTKQPH